MLSKTLYLSLYSGQDIIAVKTYWNNWTYDNKFDGCDLQYSSDPHDSKIQVFNPQYNVQMQACDNSS